MVIESASLQTTGGGSQHTGPMMATECSCHAGSTARQAPYSRRLARSRARDYTAAMESQIIAASLRLGVRPAIVRAAMRRTPDRPRVVAGLLGVSEPQLLERVAPGVPLDVALDHVLVE